MECSGDAPCGLMRCFAIGLLYENIRVIYVYVCKRIYVYTHKNTCMQTYICVYT